MGGERESGRSFVMVNAQLMRDSSGAYASTQATAPIERRGVRIRPKKPGISAGHHHHESR